MDGEVSGSDGGREPSASAGGDGGADAAAHGTEGETEVDPAERQAVYASARLVDSGAAVGALAFVPEDAGRQLGDGRTVSGWSAFQGEETDEELTDAERLRLPSLSWLVRHDPAVTMVTVGHDGSMGYWVRRGDRDDGLPHWERLQP